MTSKKYLKQTELAIQTKKKEPLSKMILKE